MGVNFGEEPEKHWPGISHLSPASRVMPGFPSMVRDGKLKNSILVHATYTVAHGLLLRPGGF